MSGTRPGGDAGRDDLQAWMQWAPTPKRGPRDVLLLTPARIVVGAGAALALVAGLMPWAEGRAPDLGGYEPVFFSGTGGAGDGVVLLVVAAGVGFLTLHRTPATSRVRIVRALPVVLVLLAAASWVNGYRAAGLEVDAWVRRGGSGGLSIGLWLAALGIVLMAVGTVVLLPEVVRWQTAPGDPYDEMHVTLGGVARVVGGIAGTLIGCAIGIGFTLGLTATPLIGLIALGAVFGGLAGAYGGAWLAGAAADRVRPPAA
jgi:hypothetical protein